jgi:predicted adenine nucleotide alpha hydrolase (AANH) superfamily ATPase
MRESYPQVELIGFFYDPNIHPYSEYYLRLLDVKRSCEILGIELIEGEYDL